MSTDNPIPTTSKTKFWIGWSLSGLCALALLVSGVMKLMQTEPLVAGDNELGFDLKSAPGIGIVELFCAVLYIVPQTSVLGAILLTGYLGGATATDIRIGDSFIAPIIIGVLVWLGLYFRDARLRALLPLRRS